MNYLNGAEIVSPPPSRMREGEGRGEVAHILMKSPVEN